MVIVLIRLVSTLGDDEAGRVTVRRLAEFRQVPGLVQKYVARGAQPHEYVGVLVFDSAGSAAAFRASPLAGTTAAAYAVAGPPAVEALPVLYTLDDAPSEPARS